MTVGSHNFVKFTVIKLNCQIHSGWVFTSGKNNDMYPNLCVLWYSLEPFIVFYKERWIKGDIKKTRNCILPRNQLLCVSYFLLVLKYKMYKIPDKKLFKS